MESMPPPMRASTRKRCECPNLLRHPSKLQQRIVTGESPHLVSLRPRNTGPLTRVPRRPPTYPPMSKAHCLVHRRPVRQGRNCLHLPSRRRMPGSIHPPRCKATARISPHHSRARHFRPAQNNLLPQHGPSNRVAPRLNRRARIILEAPSRNQIFSIVWPLLRHKMPPKASNGPKLSLHQSLHRAMASHRRSLRMRRALDSHRHSLDNARRVDSRRHSLQVRSNLSHLRKRILPGNGARDERENSNIHRRKLRAEPTSVRSRNSQTRETNQPDPGLRLKPIERHYSQFNS
jgi:hypothetical protein